MKILWYVASPLGKSHIHQAVSVDSLNQRGSSHYKDRRKTRSFNSGFWLAGGMPPANQKPGLKFLINKLMCCLPSAPATAYKYKYFTASVCSCQVPVGSLLAAVLAKDQLKVSLWATKGQRSHQYLLICAGTAMGQIPARWTGWLLTSTGSHWCGGLQGYMAVTWYPATGMVCSPGLDPLTSN